ncbi:MAG: hypothetical protein Q7R81_05595 [Candidatus Peregrinibacteria bacterium]|nr:hypothetical protein [Candidatus Peregrinibacteria bacterium]
MPQAVISILAALTALLLPFPAHALQLKMGWATSICGTYMPCSTNIAGAGAEGLALYIMSVVVTAVQVGFIAVALLMLFTYAAQMVFYSTDENALSEARMSYVYAITGAAVVGISGFLVKAFQPGVDIVNKNEVDAGLENIVLFVKFGLAALVTINVVIQGVRLITAQSQEASEKARKRLLVGFGGVAVILLGKIVIQAINPDVAAPPSALADQIIGIASFLITFFGFAAVVAILIAGFMLVISIDESNKDKAKTIIKTSLIALAVLTSAYTIVNTFLSV